MSEDRLILRAESLRAGLVGKVKRFTPKDPRKHQWQGTIVALDTEGSSQTARFTATAQWNEGEQLLQRRFREPWDLADFLISLSKRKEAVLIYCHNLEWDLQVLLTWFGEATDLRYERHIARRNGSALKATFDFVGRRKNWRKITLRDSFALWPHSLAQLGEIVGLPKLRTPKELIPNMINWRTGERIESPGETEAGIACNPHSLDECMDCYDLRDVEILWHAMKLYIDECNAARVAPSLTRSAHAMHDYRTNYLDEPLQQYSEEQNLRAQLARYGGRSQMLKTGLTTCDTGEVITQADIVSEYPAIMKAGKFPNAEHHRVLLNPKVGRLHEYVGWAWATVTVPDLPLGPLIYRHPQTLRTSYPTGVTLQAAWTTDELVYAQELGCTVDIVRLEGCPVNKCIDPFSSFIDAKWKQRAAYKAMTPVDPREASVKLTMNGFSGKFGMRWTEPMMTFCAIELSEFERHMVQIPIQRLDEESKRYPDYIMVPWSALIMARGRVMLHRFGMKLISLGAELLCCDTDSWTFKAPEQVLSSDLFGKALGQWSLEDRYVAFRGAAPKEYALYPTEASLFAREPAKARAKGVGGVPPGSEGMRAIDHYLRTGNIYFQRPQKMRSVLHGAPIATFVQVEKSRHVQPDPGVPIKYDNFDAEVRRQIEESESTGLFRRRSYSSSALSDAGIANVG